MESLNQLLNLLIYLYLGIFSYILFNVVFFHQRRLLIIKSLFFFLFIFYLTLRISHRYLIEFNFIYIIAYFIGFISAIKIFDKYLFRLNNKIIDVIDLIKFFINTSFNPPIIKFIKCYIHTNHIYRKYPYLKPKGLEYLF